MIVGAVFTYHKMLMGYIGNIKSELWKEINKLQDISDKRDDEIKTLLRERDEDMKRLIQDMKTDIKSDLEFIKERMFPKK